MYTLQFSNQDRFFACHDFGAGYLATYTPSWLIQSWNGQSPINHTSTLSSTILPWPKSGRRNVSRNPRPVTQSGLILFEGLGKNPQLNGKKGYVKNANRGLDNVLHFKAFETQ